MRRKIFIVVIIAAVVVGLLFVIKNYIKSKKDYSEYFTGYDDRISYIVEGYQMHWEGFCPENLDLSYIYKYESPYGSFIKYDLDRDGVEELLMGDQYENGDYQIYDIFTFDKTTGDIIHLFCGGERNWCSICENGVIIETGSNSANDSFAEYYILKKLKLKKLSGKQHVLEERLTLNMDKFVNYIHPKEKSITGGYTEQHELSDEDMSIFLKTVGMDKFTPLSVSTQVVAGLNYRFWCRYDNGGANNCFITIYKPLQGNPIISRIQDENGGPEMKIIIDNEGNIGRYIDETETSYHGDIQDEYWVEKDKAHLEIVKASEGRGILTLNTPGKKAAFIHPDTNSEIIGSMIHEEGYIPEVYNCLGYINGWFLADIDGKAGFIQESLVKWDAINSF